MKHLFLAPLSGSFGEAAHAVRMATELVEMGHRVRFLAPSSLGPLLSSAQFEVGYVDAVLPRLDHVTIEELVRTGCDTLVLVDLSATWKVFDSAGLSFERLTRSGVPVLALDSWNLDETGLAWDYGPERYELGPGVREVTRRLVPVPFVRPQAPGAFCGLPRLEPLSSDARELERAALGLSVGDKLVVLPLAAWQYAESQPHPARRQLADAVPRLLARYIEALGPGVKLAHVGPERLPGAEYLGASYLFLGQLGGESFANLVGAADVMLSYNLTASSIATAIARRVPVLLALSSHAGATLEEVDAQVQAASGDALSPAGRAFVEATLPLGPLCASPLSLYEFLTPVLRKNPLTQAIAVAELLEERAFLLALARLLYRPDAADALRDHQARYAAEILQLPSAAGRFLSLL